MKVIQPGHRYLPDSIDGEYIQQLIFVSRVGPRYPGNILNYPGTTSQDILRCLIDRAKYVNHQIPCWQTKLSIWLMRGIIWLYEHRAKRVKNQTLDLCILSHIEVYTPCEVCGHILCRNH